MMRSLIEPLIAQDPSSFHIDVANFTEPSLTPLAAQLAGIVTASPLGIRKTTHLSSM